MARTVRLLIPTFVLVALLATGAHAERGSARPDDGKARPALWLVRDGDTSIYLFGTIHLLRPDLYWFTGAVRDAFRECDEVVLEVKIGRRSEQKAILEKLVARSRAKDAPAMVDRLPADKREAYKRTLAKLHLPPDAFDEQPTWAAGLALASLPLAKAGFHPDSGVDSTLARLAADSSKPLVGLETFEQQFALLQGMPETTQVEFVLAALDDAERLVPQLDAMIAAWASGDSEALAAMLNQSTEDSPELWKTIFEDRNERWADWIAARMKKPGTVLLAVGAGHLAGRASVQEQLAKRGLEARRVDRAAAPRSLFLYPSR